MKRLSSSLHSGRSAAFFALRVAAAIVSVAPWGVAVIVAQDEQPEDSEARDPNAIYQEAAATVESDLKTELEILSALRQQIAEEKPPLARETNETAAEYREKSRRAELARQEKDALAHELQTIANRVKIWRDEAAYIDSLLVEFRKAHEARISLQDGAALGELFATAEGQGEAALTAKLELVSHALDRIESADALIAGEGEALGSDGVLRKGQFVQAGPVGWFFSDDGTAAGLIAEGAGLQPQIVPGTASVDEVKKLAEGQAVSPRFDPTLGTAVALDEASESLIGHIRKGGIWIYPILALALIATGAAVGKWIQLVRIRPLDPGIVRGVLEEINRGRVEAAEKRLSSVRHPVRALLERGIETRERSREEVEEALYEKYLQAQPPLGRGLPLIAIASATAPLLGLLGTVTGMIHTFKLINIFGTGDAKSLASGISEALVTTEFGLVVAIPALILHALLSRKVQGIRSTMEMASLAFVNGLEKPEKATA